MQFDARAAKLLEAGQHFTISDCPGLRLEATATRRSWIYRYKSPVDGRMRQAKIGEWPAMSLAVAAVEWERLRGARANGDDPSATRRAQRNLDRAEAAAERERQLADTVTVLDLCNHYYAKHVLRNRGTKGAAEVRRIFDKQLGALGDMRAADVTRSVAFDHIESLADTPVQAGKVRAELGAAWDYGLDSGRLPESVPNWWRLILRGKLRSKGRKLQGQQVGVAKRVLSEAELTVLIPWLPNFSRLVEDALTVYLWTAARGSELCWMHATEFTDEPDGLWWTCPLGKTKNRRREGATDFRVPIVGRAEVVVRRRLAVANGGHLFPSSGKFDHVQQKTIGAQVWMHMPYAQTRPTYERPRLPVDRWAPHDLRRTSRTLLASLGCPEEVAEAILGHMKPGVKGIYNRHEYDAEKRLWLTRLDEKLEALAAMSSAAQNLVSRRRKEKEVV
ncbi:tyrosine-type recombinase/integrase [Massilia endophytica]|uniref:tyrosine-type recombinase/integrase n=1 Tax=Massilia endophytica TaxID=2899220 RepID=UPI001E359DAF|nr:integrase family protein [Massilia endophytica]UGQ45112.1 integrase family protein [Massilia endophytica]